MPECVRPELSSLSPVSPSFLHACRKHFHVKDMAEWVHPSSSLTLSISWWILILLLAPSLQCVFWPPLRATNVLPSSQPTERAPSNVAVATEATPGHKQDVTSRERGRGGGGGGRTCTLPSSLLYPTVLSLCLLPSEGLQQQSSGEEKCTDVEFVTPDDSRWRHLKMDMTSIWLLSEF